MNTNKLKKVNNVADIKYWDSLWDNLPPIKKYEKPEYEQHPVLYPYLSSQEGEAIEIGCVPGVGNSEYGYSMARPGSNSAVNSYLNTFAAIRIIPSFFYNAYETGDMRRDVSDRVAGQDPDIDPAPIIAVDHERKRIRFTARRFEYWCQHVLIESY